MTRALSSSNVQAHLTCGHATPDEGVEGNPTSLAGCNSPWFGYRRRVLPIRRFDTGEQPTETPFHSLYFFSRISMICGGRLYPNWLSAAASSCDSIVPEWSRSKALRRRASEFLPESRGATSLEEEKVPSAPEDTLPFLDVTGGTKSLAQISTSTFRQRCEQRCGRLTPRDPQTR